MSKRVASSGLLLLTFAWALAGCALSRGEQEEREAVGVASGAIQDGVDDAESKGVVGIGIFKDNKRVAICSGSLIAPNIVLTARHCVAPIENIDSVSGIKCGKTSFGTTWDTDRFGVTTQPQMSTKLDASYHRVLQVITSEGSQFCGNDYAILLLIKPVDIAEATPIVPRVDSQVTVKEAYVAIGYGAIDDGLIGLGSGTRRRREQLKVTCLGDDCEAGLRSAMKPGLEWLGDTGICGGDSGGPALDLQGRVIGITSRGTSGCAQPLYSATSAVSEWIKLQTKVGAQLGGYEPPAWVNGYPTDPQYAYPVGGSCQKPDECSSNNCLRDGDVAYCTRACTEQATCPSGYSCDLKERKVCVKDTSGSATDGTSTGDDSGCSIGTDGSPKPIPWLTLLSTISLLGWARRRASAARQHIEREHLS